MLALLLLAAAPLLAQADRFGLPACSGPDLEIAPKPFFFVCHSAATKTPLWTAYEIMPDRLIASKPRPSRFRRDRSLGHAGASDADYRGSGWSRGHLVPARDMSFDEQAWRDSFLLSNAVPQNARMNRAEWRRLENRVRKIAETADSVIVVTGAIFTEDAGRIGPGGVAVPAELYKVVLALHGGRVSISAAILPNTESLGAPESFAVQVAEVERRTGLKFFQLLEPADCAKNFSRPRAARAPEGALPEAPAAHSAKGKKQK